MKGPVTVVQKDKVGTGNSRRLRQAGKQVVPDRKRDPDAGIDRHAGRPAHLRSDDRTRDRPGRRAHRADPEGHDQGHKRETIDGRRPQAPWLQGRPARCRPKRQDLEVSPALHAPPSSSLPDQARPSLAAGWTGALWGFAARALSRLARRGSPWSGRRRDPTISTSRNQPTNRSSARPRCRPKKMCWASTISASPIADGG